MYKLRIQEWHTGRLHTEEMTFPSRGHLDVYLARHGGRHDNGLVKIINHDGEVEHSRPPIGLTEVDVQPFLEGYA